MQKILVTKKDKKKSPILNNTLEFIAKIMKLDIKIS